MADSTEQPNVDVASEHVSEAAQTSAVHTNNTAAAAVEVPSASVVAADQDVLMKDMPVAQPANEEQREEIAIAMAETNADPIVPENKPIVDIPIEESVEQQKSLGQAATETTVLEQPEQTKPASAKQTETTLIENSEKRPVEQQEVLPVVETEATPSEQTETASSEQLEPTPEQPTPSEGQDTTEPLSVSTGKFTSPFIIESNGAKYDNDDDEDEEYEPSVPMIPKKPVVVHQHIPTGPAAMQNIPASLPQVPKTKQEKQKRYTLAQLEEQAAKNPQNIDHWNALIKSLQNSGKHEKLREVFEKVLEIFPLAGKIWVAYVTLELSLSEFLRVEKLFSRSLTTVYSIELWQKYLEYVLRTNNVQLHGIKAQTTIQQTYDFVLSKIGIDRESGKIWSRYIDFIKSKENSNTWEQQQQMDTLRKIYRQAVCIPLNNLESIWHGYNSFENSINRSTARKFLAERSAIYMTARSCLKELQNITNGLNKTGNPHTRRWIRSEDRQLQLWHNWINWEKKNPLELTNEETIKQRVSYAYSQATMDLWFYPEIWFEAAEYAFSSNPNTIDNGLEVLEMGRKANPTSALLFFKTAEIYETAGQRTAARTTYEILIANLKEELRKLENIVQEARAESKTSARTISLEKRFAEDSKNFTYAYIAFMRAVKRMEGISQARLVFSECRKLPFSTFQIYIASAFMELQNDKADIATKILEIGLKRFSSNAEYIERYIDFLIRINDETNARALFEKSISKIPPADAKNIYILFLKYESKFGELVSLKKLEDRYRALYPEGMQFFFYHFVSFCY
jgi:cleavage stimulation factor subunit 3